MENIVAIKENSSVQLIYFGQSAPSVSRACVTSSSCVPPLSFVDRFLSCRINNANFRKIKNFENEN